MPLFVLWLSISAPAQAHSGGLALEPTRGLCNSLIEIARLQSTTPQQRRDIRIAAFDLFSPSSWLRRPNSRAAANQRLRVQALTDLGSVFLLDPNSPQFKSLGLNVQSLNALAEQISAALESYAAMNDSPDMTREQLESWLKRDTQNPLAWEHYLALHQILASTEAISATIGFDGRAHNPLSILGQVGTWQDIPALLTRVQLPIQMRGGQGWSHAWFKAVWRSDRNGAIPLFSDGEMFRVHFKEHEDFVKQTRWAIQEIMGKYVEIDFHKVNGKDRIRGIRSITPDLATLLSKYPAAMEMFLGKVQVGSNFDDNVVAAAKSFVLQNAKP